MQQRFTYIFLLSAYLLLALSSHSFSSPDLRDSTWRKIYHSLQQPRLDDSSYVVHDSLRMELPDFEIVLVRGELTSLHDSSGGLTGLLFEGEAKARFAPRHHLERQQLRRFTRDSVFVSEASIILWRFVQPAIGTWSISTAGAIDGATRDENSAAAWKQLTRQPAKISDYAASLPAYLQTELLQRRGFNLASYLVSSKYSGGESGFVACAFLPDAPRALYPPLHLYLYEPSAQESIQFFRYLEKGIGRPFYTICSYPLEDYFAAPPTDSLRLTQYNGWVELSPDGKMKADMGVDIFTAGQKPFALFFQLARDLTVTRVTSEFGDTLDFVQENKEEGLAVLLPETVARLDTIRLLFHYAGDFLKKHDHGVLFLKDPVYWVPRLNYLRRAVYKIIFKYPRSMRVLAVGTLTREWEEGEHRLSFYTESTPAKAASFCLGHFNSDTLSADGLPRLEIHSSLHGKQQRRQVATDIANSLFLFDNLLSRYPATTLRIVEAPGFTSHGFPGFVTLSWIGFQAQLEGATEALRSHEVAHQWFGNVVGWATYRDQWLSEAFAEYLGALYVEWVDQNRKHFENLVEAWRDDLLEGGSVGVALGLKRFGLGRQALKKSEGMAAGPLWMGIRLGQKEPLDYYVQTYMKGAYVLHMLRWLLRDLDTGSDTKFWKLLSDFISTYQNADPSTQDFQKVAEKNYGAALDWFFKQWIYDTAVPTYLWRYRTTPTDSGDRVEFFVQQEKVPPEFRMPVPVTVEYGDGIRLTQRVWVNHEGGQGAFPPRGTIVKRVIFNEGRAVLCRVREK